MHCNNTFPSYWAERIIFLLAEKIKRTRSFARASDDSMFMFLFSAIRQYDWILVSALLLLLCLGLISLFSLSGASAYPFFQRQLVWLAAGLILLAIASMFDFRIFRAQSGAVLFVYGISIALKNNPSEYVWGILPGRAMNSISDLQNFKEICLDVSNLYEKKIDLMLTKQERMETVLFGDEQTGTTGMFHKVNAMYEVFTKSVTIREMGRFIVKNFIVIGSVATAWYAISHIFNFHVAKD